MRLRDKKGFTLLEVMIVVAIIGITAAIAIPSYLTYLPHLRLKSAARDIASTLNVARMKAIANNTSKYVLFDPANDTYTNNFRSDGTEDPLYTSASRDWKDTKEVDILAPAGGKYDMPTFPGNKVTYSSYGTPSDLDVANKYYAVYLKNSKDEEYRVLVTSLTGKVVVEKWNGVDKWE